MDTGIDTGTALYQVIAEKIRRSVAEGDLRPGQLVGSEHALARESSISRMTIRRASQLLMDEGLLERRPGKGLFVRDPGSSTGPSAPGSSPIVAKQSQVIKLIAGNLQWEPSFQVSRGILSVAKTKGLEVQLCDAQGDAGFDVAMLKSLPQGEARGAVIMALHSAPFNEAIYHLKIAGFPFVLIDGRLDDIEVPYVLADNYSGGLQATGALLRKGHRRIAFIGDLVARTVRDRLQGMRDAMGDGGLAFDRSLVIDLSPGPGRLGDWSGAAEQSVRDLMARPNPPTAIFCSCDAVARSVYRGLGAMKLRVPDDVSVVGFDNDPLAEWLTPALTTVRQPFQEMGVAAAELLCSRMADPAAPVEHKLLPVELVERGSVAPPR